MTRTTFGVPDLDDVAGHWVDAEEIAHLPSLRNQLGQSHVNSDLTSTSWLVAPPFTLGYHTGELRVDGRTPAAQRFRWKPWGVLREHRGDGLLIRTDTRMALSRDLLLWQISVTNEDDRTRTVELSQDLYAMVAHTETGYGWLYDVPWNHGNHHDFMALERIRATTGGRAPSYLLSPAPRLLRLGRPRVPGIQRDEDTGPMLLDDALPSHFSPDKEPEPRTGVAATVRSLQVSSGDDGPGPVLDVDGPVTLTPDDEAAFDAFVLTPGTAVSFDLRLDAAGQSGTVLTHGNHPDSLQIGVEDGRLWLGITGEREYGTETLPDGTWHRVSARVEADHAVLTVDGKEVARTRHWTESHRWTSRTTEDPEPQLTVEDTRSAARAGYAFSGPSPALSSLGAGGRATWTLDVEPGQTLTVGIACAYGTDTDDVRAQARAAARDFEATLRAGEDGWHRHWTHMFTPGNPDFSGHLPTLDTQDAGLAKTYYMGALQLLYMRNTRIRPGEPVFLTGGPRLGPTTTYFWDHSEWSRMYALLEPAGLRSWLLRVLAGPYRESFGIDARSGGPLGNAYSANDHALFRLIEHYVCITGDTGFLDTPAGAATVLEHLERLGFGWRDRRRPATGGVLADFGDDPWQLLECVPSYTGVVASFNGAYVGTTRSLAGLYRRRGRHQDADRAAAEARQLADAVLDLYAGDGRWHIRRPDATDTIGHCLDFGLVAASLHEDLDPRVRREMADFVESDLLVAGWMRALSPNDPIAATSDRPDHGAGGAFCAWPGVTAHGLARLGFRDRALTLLRDLSSAASGGLWGQAMEIVTGPDGRPRARVAERGVSNRETIAGAAGAEAVMSALFDLNPSFADGGDPESLPDSITVDGIGTLSGIRRRPHGA
ncbi:laminin G domain-containing protein [Streptacidiphilus sp. N1-10]|uniref:Laminin G domain-containing protein n=1 Tax=Streptacidiphilus jeojiensis TaxID=3229225 RepID=A0ABV6XGM0_9ACTN